MSTEMKSLKLVVGDLAVTEKFYTALGMKLMLRTSGGEGNVRQEQVWLSHTGDDQSSTLILSHFLEVPPPPRSAYPGETWLVFHVDDMIATEALVEREGGSILRAGEDRPEYQVRAAVVADPEGHIIELVGPMLAR